MVAQLYAVDASRLGVAHCLECAIVALEGSTMAIRGHRYDCYPRDWRALPCGFASGDSLHGIDSVVRFVNIIPQLAVVLEAEE